MNEVGLNGVRPASVRLVDNVQFLFGRALVPDEDSTVKQFINAIKKWFIINVKGFDPDRMAAATLVFEGSEKEVRL
jgi:alkyldihydroxyacetonephosphate synthase